MKIFISWSGNLSQKIAEAFNDWLPKVFQSIETYFSEEDTKKGTRWADEIARQLEESFFGLICLTKDNIQAPWLNFEAGALSALSEAVGKSKVCPFLLDIKRSDLQDPLRQFQSVIYDHDDIFRFVISINASLPAEDQLKDEQLKETYEVWWPKLQDKLDPLAKEAFKRNSAETKKALVRYPKDVFEMIQKEIKKEDIDDRVLVSILSECFKLIELKNKITDSATTLDDISNWIKNEYLTEANRNKKISVKRIADMSDYACSVASQAAANELNTQLKSLEALRFAELSTWALGRCEDYQLCIAACEFGTAIINKSSDNIDERLSFLARCDFARIKASAYLQLSDAHNDEHSRYAAEELGKLPTIFSENLRLSHNLKLEDWRDLGNKVPDEFKEKYRADQESNNTVYVLASFGDCISAVYILLFLQKIEMNPIWIEKQQFGNNTSIDEYRDLAIIGGPDVWKRNRSIMNRFKHHVGRETWENLYPGDEIKYEVIPVKDFGKKHILLAGNSKFATQKAVIDFSNRLRESSWKKI